MGNLALDPRLVASMGRRGRELFEARFSQEIAVQKYRDLLTSDS